ncbi:MAG: hypothetical protein WBE41_23280, partial [Terracidiphilus sp.]
PGRPEYRRPAGFSQAPRQTGHVDRDPTQRAFGSLNIGEGGALHSFAEKPRGDGRWVSGGVFVLSPAVGAYLKDDATVWEREPMEALSREGHVSAFKHEGFWHPMDTVFDKNELENYWAGGHAPWKVWA